MASGYGQSNYIEYFRVLPFKLPKGRDPWTCFEKPLDGLLENPRRGVAGAGQEGDQSLPNAACAASFPYVHLW
jgi:hypothetical protein